jgi:predicted nucleotidyltransferase
MSTQDALTVAKTFVAVVSERYPVEKAYVFGSYAKGKANESSDIDVCVVSPVFGKDYLAEEMDLMEMSVRVDPRLSPVAFSPEDIQDKYSQLAHEITKYGIQV